MQATDRASRIGQYTSDYERDRRTGVRLSHRNGDKPVSCPHCSSLRVEPPSNEALRKAYDAYEKADFATALELLFPFAEAGEVVAQCAIGSLFHLGLGTAHDDQIAIKWYSAAAKQGCSLSWNNLASIHWILGDKDQARECYRRAVEIGFDLGPADYYDRL